MTTTVTIAETPVEVTVSEEAVTANITETETTVTVDTGVTDHGALTGLDADDHPQYLLKAGGTMTGALTLAGAPSADLHAATKLYVDTEVAGAGGGASDVGDLTTTGLAAGNMLRVAAAGGLEERTPAEVLGDIGAAASADLADYLPLTGGTVTGDTQFNARVAMRGNVSAAGAEITGLSFYNNIHLVAKIAVVSTDATQDDGDIVFSTAGNQSLTEKFRIPRQGVVNFPAAGYTIDGTEVGMSSNNDSAVLAGRNAVRLYSLLLGRDYAAFNAHSASAYGAFLSPGSSRTNQIFNILELRHDTSGIPAAGFGAGLAFQLDSSTTENQNAARIAAVWTEATHATRKADLVLSAYDTAERVGLRVRATGSAALLITDLPTADPHVAGALWSDGGIVTVSSG